MKGAESPISGLPPGADPAYPADPKKRAGMARHVMVSGLRGKPEVVLNGVRLDRVGRTIPLDKVSEADIRKARRVID